MVSRLEPQWAINRVRELADESMRKQLAEFAWPQAAKAPEAGEPYGRKVLLESDRAKLVLIQWRPEMSTAIHDHGGGHGTVFVLQGEIHEICWESSASLLGGAAPTQKNHATGGSVPLLESSVHAMKALGTTTALSLHLYIDESRAMYIYDLPKQKRLTVPVHHGAWQPTQGNIIEEIPWASL